MICNQAPIRIKVDERIINLIGFSLRPLVRLADPRKYIGITTIDEGGKVVFRRNFENKQEHILDYFLNLDAPTNIVIESMCSWYWLHDLLGTHHFDVVISNLVKTKAIVSAKFKNDKVDSHMLAQLLRANLIATVNVCSLKPEN